MDNLVLWSDGIEWRIVSIVIERSPKSAMHLIEALLNLY